MTFTAIDNTTTNTTSSEASETTQNFDTQLSILSDKGFNQKALNLRLLGKFEGDLEKVEKRLLQIQTNHSSLRERILNQYQSSLDQLSQRGVSDHPRLPALLKKFDGDVDQIIAFIEKSSPKAKKDQVHPKKIKDHTQCKGQGKGKGLKNKTRASDSSPSSPGLETSPSPSPSPSSSPIEETSTSSSSSDLTPISSPVEPFSILSQAPVPDQTPKSSDDKAERKAKKQALKQQIRELQLQMKEINAHQSAQKQEKDRKKKERQEKLILREAKILKNLSELKLKTSKTNEMIQRQEEQLAKVRSFLSVEA